MLLLRTLFYISSVWSLVKPDTRRSNGCVEGPWFAAANTIVFKMNILQLAGATGEPIDSEERYRLSVGEHLPVSLRSGLHPVRTPGRATERSGQ